MPPDMSKRLPLIRSATLVIMIIKLSYPLVEWAPQRTLLNLEAHPHQKNVSHVIRLNRPPIFLRNHYKDTLLFTE
jgi:hypothetical protein